MDNYKERIKFLSKMYMYFRDFSNRFSSKRKIFLIESILKFLSNKIQNTYRNENIYNTFIFFIDFLRHFFSSDLINIQPVNILSHVH